MSDLTNPYDVPQNNNPHDGHKNKLGMWKKFEVICDKCNIAFIVIEREKLFPIRKRYWCSASCMNRGKHSEGARQKLAEYANAQWSDETQRTKKINGMNTPEQIEKVRKRMTERMQNPDHLQKLLDGRDAKGYTEERTNKIRQSIKKVWADPSYKERMYDLWLSGRTGWLPGRKQSYAEKKAEEYFITKGYVKDVDYIIEYRVLKKPLGVNGLYYSLDFYFPKYKLNIEVDGNQHKFIKELDEARDYILTTKLNINVQRVPWNRCLTTFYSGLDRALANK